MIGRWHGLVVDCPDPDRLALFYQELLGARTRREREAEDAVNLAHELLECGQLLVNAVAKSLGGDSHYATIWPD